MSNPKHTQVHYVYSQILLYKFLSSHIKMLHLLQTFLENEIYSVCWVRYWHTVSSYFIFKIKPVHEDSILRVDILLVICHIQTYNKNHCLFRRIRITFWTTNLVTGSTVRTITTLVNTIRFSFMIMNMFLNWCIEIFGIRFKVVEENFLWMSIWQN